ncbi:RNA polymerase sigma factor [Agarilytica rhodophyticola]|uniref:RNA polymerase sigma factor n=1 Tax=Agarilytica rhodophyticola TaxID=1737490 RepID=UPI001C1F676D|nr:RNA polymerase sigma factor [Agarilytica rhodophyticola]
MKDIKQIIEQEFVRLRRFAYSLTGSKADAEDLVQNLIVKLLKSEIPDNREPIAWMFTVCKNLWIDEIRARGVRMKAANDERIIVPNDDNNEQHVHAQMEMSKVMEKMSLLSDSNRIALSLVAIEGMSYAEAAAVAGVPTGTIMSRVARARSSLANLLNRKGHE